MPTSYNPNIACTGSGTSCLLCPSEGLQNMYSYSSGTTTIVGTYTARPQRQEPTVVYVDRPVIKEVVVEKTPVVREIIRETVIEKPVEKIVYIKEEQTMFTFWGILGIVIICLIVVKFVAPRVTLKNIIRGFWHLIWKPGKKTAKEVKADWEEVSKE